MTKGGARNRSGPQPDFLSARSDARGLKAVLLPSEGRQGEPPVSFPLVAPVLMTDDFENGKPVKVKDDEESKIREVQEIELWNQVWSYPQAVAWEREPWRWPIVAMWVRTFLTAAGPEGKAADRSTLHRYSDQLGLSPAGLKENGWSIAADEVAVARVAKKSEEVSVRPRRMRAVPDGG